MNAPADPYPAPLRSLLVVDDDVDTLESLRDFFALHGFVVHTAENGRQALDLFDGLRDPLGCILLDINMPVMDGRELMAELRHRRGVPPVIILTANDYEEPPPGARHYFLKPPLFDVLLRAVVSCSLRRAAPRA